MKPENLRRRRPMYNEALGRAIKVIRAEQGVERRELAERAGISYSYLAEIENGNKPPSSQVLIAISEALGMRPSELHAVVDSLQTRTTGESRLSARQTNIAASAERAFLRSRRVAPDQRMMAPQPTPPDRQAALHELMGLLERMSDEDLEMLVRMARRLGT